MDKQDKPKGFNGLSKLVSDLSDLPNSESIKEETHSPFAGIRNSTQSESKSGAADKGNRESSSNSKDASDSGGVGFFWILFGVFLFLLVIGGMISSNRSQQSTKTVVPESQSSSTPRVVDQHPQKQNVSGSSIESKKSRGKRQEQTSTQSISLPNETQRFSSKMPPVGINDVHSISEIRWCLAQHIRIDAVRTLNKTQANVARFNRWVDDYNSRCGSYRYRQGNLESARRDVEPYRSEIWDAARKAASAPEKKKTGSLTKKIQLALKSLGYEPGPADGIYGTNTAKAIKQYQRQNSLRVDGKVSERLLEALEISEAIR